MATFYAGIADTDGIQLTADSVVFAASGGTLDDSNLVQVNWDGTAFDGTVAEGKQRLVAALKLITQRIETAKLWPVTTAS
jgi:hypothetical protein